MKRFLTLILLLATVVLCTAQNQYCFGLKNPVNFTLYNNANTGQYTGMVGTKPNAASSCTTGTVGLNLTTPVGNGQLATTVDNGSSSYCGTTMGASNQFRIMSAGDGNDPLVGNNPALPVVSPGFQKSIRVGNCQTSAHAEALYYTMKVVPKNALLFINYAIVVQQPGHGVNQDPIFIIRVTKQDGGTWRQISDTLCYMVSSTPASSGGSVTIGQDGWHSTSGSSGGTIYYKDWSQVAISLNKYLYQTVRVEIMIGDCSASGHFGYCYITGDCQEMSLTTNGCAAGATEQVAEIKAPVGLNAYQWYCSNTGVLTGPARTADSSYYPMIGQQDSVLQVASWMFVNQYTRQPMNQNSFKCVMRSYMNPAIPVLSTLFAEVGSMKPTLNIDSVLDCDGTVNLQDLSEVLYIDNDEDNKIDTSATQWIFYDDEHGTGDSLYMVTGGKASFRYDSAGVHSVKVRTSSFKMEDGERTCWNEKIVRLRSLDIPNVSIEFEQDSLCYGDTAVFYDLTPGSIYHRWHLSDNRGLDTTITTEGPGGERLELVVNASTHVELWSHTNSMHMQDTNHDGVLDTLYCDGYTDTILQVGEFPVLTVAGDVVVCKGTQSVVDVTSSVPGCRIDWYEVRGGQPIQTNTTRLITTPTRDTRYYVKVTSPNGCVSWDSITIGIVSPTLHYWTRHGGNEICPGDTVVLWAGNAAAYEWKAVPDRGSLEGQAYKDTIKVVPTESVTYILTGHGSNGCSASPVSQNIVVIPYPILDIEVLPSFIDSESPVVRFKDNSPYRATTWWSFGDGQESDVRTVAHTYEDLFKDTITATVEVANILGCAVGQEIPMPVSRFAVWVPNAFTPLLELNNTFRPITNNVLRDYEFFIYNRNGELVFHTTEQSCGWGGTYKGVPCPEGTYTWIIKYRRGDIQSLKEKVGTVSLLR